MTVKEINKILERLGVDATTEVGDLIGVGLAPALNAIVDRLDAIDERLARIESLSSQSNVGCKG